MNCQRCGTTFNQGEICCRGCGAQLLPKADQSQNNIMQEIESEKILSTQSLENYGQVDNNCVDSELSEKEIKKHKKDQKKLLDKAANAIGTTYFLLLGAFGLIGYIISVFSVFIAPNIQTLKLLTILNYVWDLLVPIIGAIILEKTTIKKIAYKVNEQNYLKVKKTVKQQLIILGVLNFAINIGNIIAFIPYVVLYIIASKRILDALKREANIS